MKLKLQEKFWIGTFILLWLIVSTVSTIHSVEFFKLSNNLILSWSLAFAFEIGAIASLGGLLISRGTKTLIWFLFIVLTAFQIHCNMYWSWVNAKDLTQWIHLLNLVDEDPDTQRRIFAAISGGILPLLALGFMKSLMDYLKPKQLKNDEEDIKPGDNIVTQTTIENESSATKDTSTDTNLTASREYKLDDQSGTIAFTSDSTINTNHPLGFTDEDIARNEELRKQEMIINPLTEEEKNKLSDLNNIQENSNVLDTELEDSNTKSSEPFWSKLDAEKTLDVLSKSSDKVSGNQK